jgi:endonuclease G
MTFFKIVLLFFVLFIFVSCSDSSTNPSWNWKQDLNPVHSNLGLPVDSDSSDDYIIHRHAYSLSYNKELCVANWAAWNMNKDWFGSTDRFTDFLVDPALKPEFKKVYNEDYNNSGYDRGHIVRSADRTNTYDDNKSTFYMTNIYPQSPSLNQGPWAYFEDYCGKLCEQQNKELYIFAGGVFITKKKIRTFVTIPDSCYKIVVIMERGQTAKDVDTNTTVIAVMMPNKSGINGTDWKLYKTSIDNIEQSTGYNFLSAVADSVQKIIETRK